MRHLKIKDKTLTLNCGLLIDEKGLFVKYLDVEPEIKPIEHFKG